MGLTQLQVADGAKLGARTVQRFEEGEVPTAVLTAIRMARLLGSSVEELFGAAVSADHQVHPRLGRPREERPSNASTAPDAAR